MSPSFLVKSATKNRDVPDFKGFGPFTSIDLVLQEYGTEATTAANWFAKGANVPLPEPGITLEGTVEQGTHGPKFKKGTDGPRGGGGGKEYKADPAKQAAIAMESCHKVAVDILRIAMEHGAWTAPAEKPVGEMTGVVKTISAALYAQIRDAMESGQ